MSVFRNKSVVIVVAMVTLLASVRRGFAAVITAVGLDTATLANWRTTSTAKPLDIDGDDVYGSVGYFAFATGNLGDFRSGSAFGAGDLNGLPSWLTLTANGASQSYSGAYELIDNPTLTPGPSVADINSGFSWRPGVAANTDANLFNLNFGAGTPTGIIRIGILINSGSYPDATKSFTLTDANSATVTVGSILNMRYALFDVQAAPGDVVTLSGQLATGPGNLGISGISVDLAVPEPASVGLFALAGVGFLLRRRRV